MSLFDDLSGARFSACGLYRYELWRVWDATKPLVLWLMLNPSKADASHNDPTIERCQRRSVALAFGGLMVTNIFAYRSTAPEALYEVADPVGPLNDMVIMESCRRATIVLCGWGGHGALHERGIAVLRMLQQAGITPRCLAVNADGSPKHPLYVSYKQEPIALPMATWDTGSSATLRCTLLKCL